MCIEIGNLICLRHFYRLTVIVNLKLLLKKTCVHCATYSELPYNSNTMFFFFKWLKCRKREAQLVHYPNGAVAPYDPNVAIATANHYAAKVFPRFQNSDINS